MKTLGDIFLEMNTDEANLLILRRYGLLGILRIREIVQRDGPAKAERQVILTDLIVLGHVRIEVILAVKFADRRDLATEHESRQRREAQRLFVHDRKRTGKSEAHGTDVGVRLGAMLHGTATKHFCLRFQLHVNFETNRGNVFRHESYFRFFGEGE